MFTSLIIILIIAGAYYGGYRADSHSRSIPAASEPAIPTLYSQWVVANEPPVPGILINGQNIKIYRGSYTWNQSKGGNEVQAIFADAAAVPPVMMAAVVPAGSEIETHTPSRIKEFRISNITKEFAGGNYSYTVPAAKGIYTYKIYCEWLGDQGQADYYFSIQVK
jgi:hypothetical protein